MAESSVFEPTDVEGDVQSTDGVQPYLFEPVRSCAVGLPQDEELDGVAEPEASRIGSVDWKYRYTAYRQLVRWCYGFLGRSIRVPLPSCAVDRIRTEYPDKDGEYRGFQLPHL